MHFFYAQYQAKKFYWNIAGICNLDLSKIYFDTNCQIYYYDFEYYFFTMYLISFPFYENSKNI